MVLNESTMKSAKFLFVKLKGFLAVFIVTTVISRVFDREKAKHRGPLYFELISSHVIDGLNES